MNVWVWCQITGVVIEWTSRWSVYLYTCIYTKVGTLSLLICVCVLTEVGTPMIIRVNNDVTLGLTQWPVVNPNVTSLLTPLIIGLPTSVRSLSHNRERPYRPLCIYRYTDQRHVHSITTPVCQINQKERWMNWIKRNGGHLRLMGKEVQGKTLRITCKKSRVDKRSFACRGCMLLCDVIVTMWRHSVHVYWNGRVHKQCIVGLETVAGIHVTLNSMNMRDIKSKGVRSNIESFSSLSRGSTAANCSRYVGNWKTFWHLNVLRRNYWKWTLAIVIQWALFLRWNVMKSWNRIWIRVNVKLW